MQMAPMLVELHAETLAIEGPAARVNPNPQSPMPNQIPQLQLGHNQLT